MMRRDDPSHTNDSWSTGPAVPAARETDGRTPRDGDARGGPGRRRGGRLSNVVGFILPALLILSAVAYVGLRSYVHKAMGDALPQLDGQVQVPGASAPFFGLSAPVTVQRDGHGVPYIHAGSMDDLVFAQGYVTAQDRLWEMELLRRNAAGDLAAVLGSALLEHDRLERTLQMRAAADRAVAVLPADQRHWLDVYARGVNASIAAQHDHLPLEFRILRYQTLAPWTPRDSLLIELVMYQDLSTSFTEELGREALAARLSPELMADLYPVGSWRDHPPGEPAPDLTAPRPEFEDIPLDRSQTRLRRPAPAQSNSPQDLLALRRTMDLFHEPCDWCVAGSNGWAVSGARTASGKPMLSNDMHLTLMVPGLWYEADLEAQNAPPLAAFHAAGVTLPGTPFVIAGHNAHVAWGFTNLGGDVQDVYVEHTRGTPSGAEYESADGTWRPIRYHRELIHVRNAPDVTLDVPLVRHGDAEIPIISGVLPGERRSLSLRWTIYDPANVTEPFFGVDSAADWASMLSAFATFGGPTQNLMYADDEGHIGYHAVGRVPVRGDLANPGPLSPVPTDAIAPDAATHEWAGYIPFDQMPQALDPPDGIVATANGRVTLDGYRYPITLNWLAPYRTQRIYKVLGAGDRRIPLTGDLPAANGSTSAAPATGHKLTPADMLALQTDVYSEPDRIVAQRLAYAIDHATGPLKGDKVLHEAADILRKWNGMVEADAAAPAIVNAARREFWPMLLTPRLAPQLADRFAKGDDLSKGLSSADTRDSRLWSLYTWGERTSVEEQMVTNFPARWLPQGFASWEDFLAAVVKRGLRQADAPRDLKTWQEGKAFPIDLENPIFLHSSLLKSLIGAPTGTGPQAQSGDRDTVKQVGATFGPSERFTADLSDPDRTTLNIVLGQSGNLSSPWYMDQFSSWLHGSTYSLPFNPAATQGTIAHTLVLRPR